MRNSSYKFSKSQKTKSKITIDDPLLRFSGFSINDYVVSNDGYYGYDSSSFDDTLLRIATVNSCTTRQLFYSYCDNLPGLSPWVNSDITVSFNSIPGLFGNRIFWQTADGKVHSAIITESGITDQVEIFTQSQELAIAPISETEFYAQYVTGVSKRVFYYNTATDVKHEWCGSLFAEKHSIKSFDAERVNDIDYVFTTDANGNRAVCLEVDVAGFSTPEWAEQYYVIPIDVVDVDSFFNPHFASVLNGNLFLTGHLARPASKGMLIYTKGPTWSLGKEMFIGFPANTYQTGKLHIIGDEVWYLGVDLLYKATATSYVGVDKSFEIDDFYDVRISKSANTADTISLIVKNADNIRPGMTLKFDGVINDKEYNYGIFDIDSINKQTNRDGQEIVLYGRSFPHKRLSQWVSDSSLDYWSQTKHNAMATDISKSIRKAGEWVTYDSGTDNENLRLRSIGDSIMYVSAKSSKNSTMAAKFKKLSTTATDYDGVSYGVGVNYYEETVLDAAERLDREIEDVDEDDQKYYGILALWGVKEHNGSEGISVYLVKKDAQTYITSVALSVPNQTDHWISIKWIDGHIFVYYRLDSSEEWLSIIDYLYDLEESPYITDTDQSGRGFVFGRVSEQSVSTTLFQDITFDASTIPVTSHQNFPDTGTIKIDDESIPYTSKGTLTETTTKYLSPAIIYRPDLAPTTTQWIWNKSDTANVTYTTHRVTPDLTANNSVLYGGINYYKTKITYPFDYSGKNLNVSIYLSKLSNVGSNLLFSAQDDSGNILANGSAKYVITTSIISAIHPSYSWVNFKIPGFTSDSAWFSVSNTEISIPYVAGSPTIYYFISTVNLSGNAPYTYGGPTYYRYYADTPGTNRVLSNTAINFKIELPTPGTQYYRLYLGNGYTSVNYMNDNLVVTSGTGIGRVFTNVGSGYNYVLVLEDTSTIDNTSSLKFFSQTTRSLNVFYVNRQSNSSIHLAGASVSLVENLTVESCPFSVTDTRYYSSEKDITVSDMIIELCAKAGVSCSSKKLINKSVLIGTPWDIYIPESSVFCNYESFNADDNIIVVDDYSDLPSSGVAEIDDENIYYGQKSTQERTLFESFFVESIGDIASGNLSLTGRRVYLKDFDAASVTVSLKVIVVSGKGSGRSFNVSNIPDTSTDSFIEFNENTSSILDTTSKISFVVTDNTLVNIIRGYQGTRPATHESGTMYIQVSESGLVNDVTIRNKRNFIVDLEYLFVGEEEVGVYGLSYGDQAVILTVNSSGVRYYSYINGEKTLIEQFPYPSSGGKIKISLFEDTISIWVNKKFVHSFYVSDNHYTEVKENEYCMGLISSESVSVFYSIDEISNRVDNCILDIGQTGDQILTSIIGEKKVYTKTAENGALEVFLSRDEIAEEIEGSFEFAESWSDANSFSRLRVEGISFCERYDEFLMRNYGNTFRLLNSNESNEEYEIISFADLELNDIGSNVKLVRMLGFADPRVEVHDKINTTKGQILVDSISYSFNTTEQDVTFEFDISGRVPRENIGE